MILPDFPRPKPQVKLKAAISVFIDEPQNAGQFGKSLTRLINACHRGQDRNASIKEWVVDTFHLTFPTWRSILLERRDITLTAYLALNGGLNRLIHAAQTRPDSLKALNDGMRSGILPVTNINGCFELNERALWSQWSLKMDCRIKFEGKFETATITRLLTELLTQLKIKDSQSRLESIVIKALSPGCIEAHLLVDYEQLIQLQKLVQQGILQDGSPISVADPYQNSQAILLDDVFPSDGAVLSSNEPLVIKQFAALEVARQEAKAKSRRAWGRFWDPSLPVLASARRLQSAVSAVIGLKPPPLIWDGWFAGLLQMGPQRLGLHSPQSIRDAFLCWPIFGLLAAFLCCLPWVVAGHAGQVATALLFSGLLTVCGAWPCGATLNVCGTGLGGLWMSFGIAISASPLLVLNDGLFSATHDVALVVRLLGGLTGAIASLPRIESSAWLIAAVVVSAVSIGLTALSMPGPRQVWIDRKVGFARFVFATGVGALPGAGLQLVWIASQVFPGNVLILACAVAALSSGAFWLCGTLGTDERRKVAVFSALQACFVVLLALLAGTADSLAVRLISGGMVTGLLHASIFTLSYHIGFRLGNERSGIAAALMEGVGGYVGFILSRLL